MTTIALLLDSTVLDGILQNNPPGIHVKFKDKEIAVTGCHVSAHGPRLGLHAENAATVTGTGKVKIKGLAVVLNGDVATCGDSVVTHTSGISSP